MTSGFLVCLLMPGTLLAVSVMPFLNADMTGLFLSSQYLKVSEEQISHLFQNFKIFQLFRIMLYLIWFLELPKAQFYHLSNYRGKGGVLQGNTLFFLFLAQKL